MDQPHGHIDVLDAPLDLYFLTSFYCIYPRPSVIWKRVSVHIRNIFVLESQLSFIDKVLDPSFQRRAIFCRVPPIARMIVATDILIVPPRVWWLQWWDINW